MGLTTQEINYLVSLWVEREECDYRNFGTLPQHRDRCKKDGKFCTFNFSCRYRGLIREDIKREEGAEQ